MNTIEQEIEILLSEMQKQIAEAASTADFGRTGKLSQDAKEIEGLKGQVKEIRRRLEGWTKQLKGGATQFEAPKSGFRKMYCEVTGGCLRQNLLTLTKQIQRGVVKIGEVLEIEVEDGSKFVTDVVEKGNKLRERGEIARFYRDSRVLEGDYIVLEERSQGKWLLRKVRGDEQPPEASWAKYQF